MGPVQSTTSVPNSPSLLSDCRRTAERLNRDDVLLATKMAYLCRLIRSEFVFGFADDPNMLHEGQIRSQLKIRDFFTWSTSYQSTHRSLYDKISCSPSGSGFETNAISGYIDNLSNNSRSTTFFVVFGDSHDEKEYLQLFRCTTRRPLKLGKKLASIGSTNADLAERYEAQHEIDSFAHSVYKMAKEASDVVIAGAGIGGAIATLFARELSNIDSRLSITTVTFGAPPVLDKAAAQSYCADLNLHFPVNFPDIKLCSSSSPTSSTDDIDADETGSASSISAPATTSFMVDSHLKQQIAKRKRLGFFRHLRFVNPDDVVPTLNSCDLFHVDGPIVLYQNAWYKLKFDGPISREGNEELFDVVQDGPQSFIDPGETFEGHISHHRILGDSGYLKHLRDSDQFNEALNLKSSLRKVVRSTFEDLPNFIPEPPRRSSIDQ